MDKEKLLIVDDEKIVREAFTVAFGDEYEISNAASGKEALKLLKHGQDIKMAIVDVMMPDLNGIELIAKLKKLNPKLKIILLTGFASKMLVTEAMRKGADKVIEKPFDIKETRELIKKLLKPKE